MRKINVIQVANIAGVALGVVGTLLTGWAQTKNNKVDIAKLVDKALKEK